MAGDPEARFRAHKNYIEAFAWVGGRTLVTRSPTALADLAQAVTASGCAKEQPVPDVDLDQVHTRLRNAWSTELLLGLPGQWSDDDELIRLSNTWGVVQAYYVGYHATQALAVAKGMPRPTSHPKTQQLYATLWADRPLSLPPWTLGIGESGWRNLPPSVSLDGQISAWSQCSSATAWSLAAKALETTRREAVRQALKRKREDVRRHRQRAWQADEHERVRGGKQPRSEPPFARPNLTAAEKAAASRTVRTFTFLDYLYRLRIGANYEDAAVFFDGPTDETESTTVHQRLVYLAAGTMLLAEMRISSLVGIETLHRWADDFISGSLPAGYHAGISARRVLL